MPRRRAAGATAVRMSRKGTAGDNAVAERFHGVEHDLVERDLVELDLVEHIEGFYGPKRRPSHRQLSAPLTSNAAPLKEGGHRRRCRDDEIHRQPVGLPMGIGAPWSSGLGISGGAGNRTRVRRCLRTNVYVCIC